MVSRRDRPTEQSPTVVHHVAIPGLLAANALAGPASVAVLRELVHRRHASGTYPCMVVDDMWTPNRKEQDALANTSSHRLLEASRGARERYVEAVARYGENSAQASAILGELDNILLHLNARRQTDDQASS
jgi:hypothetical protein